MELTVLAAFGELPDDPRELARKYMEADWLDRRKAKLISGELAVILIASAITILVCACCRGSLFHNRARQDAGEKQSLKEES